MRQAGFLNLFGVRYGLTHHTWRPNLPNGFHLDLALGTQDLAPRVRRMWRPGWPTPRPPLLLDLVSAGRVRPHLVFWARAVARTAWRRWRPLPEPPSTRGSLQILDGPTFCTDDGAPRTP